jgi:hypothetical protein
MDLEAQRQMDTEPQPNDFLLLGRELQNKRGPPGAWASAERDFREFFGAGCVVVAILWRMLNEHDLVPEGGKIVHLLWTLHFVRAYPKAGHACAVAGGLGGNIDPKTYRKYVWQFIYAIADAESIMVSCLLQILQMLLLVKISLLYLFSRFFLRIVKIAEV